MTQHVIVLPQPLSSDVKPYALEDHQVVMLDYVAQLLTHGITPRIISVDPGRVQEEFDDMRDCGDFGYTEVPEFLTDAGLWEAAKDADSELDLYSHFLDGVTEDMDHEVRRAIKRLLGLDQFAS